MSFQQLLGFQEKVVFDLRSLYNTYGYGQYKMSKFEEYDLYAKNKDFLISDSVITFTDLGGKLMALKPDVTLSIVKNTKDVPCGVKKLYYNENIYRVAKGSGAFREMMQVGLECIGDVDSFCIGEVLTLAAKSLASISEDCVLNISDLGLLTALLDEFGFPASEREPVLRAIAQKNTHELVRMADSFGVSGEKVQKLMEILSKNDSPASVLALVSEISEAMSGHAKRVREILSCVEEDVLPMLRFDFSVVDDIHYYNGIVFKGYISGVPESVLSGGQYDKLMRKMNRSSNAIGFAVYLDALEHMYRQSNTYDVDVLILYSGSVKPELVSIKANALRQEGKRVMVQKAIPEGLRYASLLDMTGEE